MLHPTTALRLSTHTACTMLVIPSMLPDTLELRLQPTVQTAVLPLLTQFSALTEHGGLITENKDF